ncbi:MAG: hypothetical protein LPH19_13290, partial [Shewanella sp.]|nr:hypothetical protein [Shewanella sp.]
MSKRYSAAFLVLLYGKEAESSETLNSLKSLALQEQDCLLVIWNNGPKPLQERDLTEFEQLGVDVTICESIENRSLSKIYNQFIAEFKSEKYIVLDDDSQLNQEYLQAVFELKPDEVGVPQIFSNQKLTGPKRNRKLCVVGESV